MWNYMELALKLYDLWTRFFAMAIIDNVSISEKSRFQFSSPDHCNGSIESGNILPLIPNANFVHGILSLPMDIML